MNISREWWVRVLRGLSFCIATTGIVLVGCSQTIREESSDGRPMPPPPRAAPVVPQGTGADHMAIQAVPKARDTNGNGFPDMIELLAYLFSDDHASPLYEDGAFVFELYFAGQADRPDAEPIRTWRIEGDELEQAKAGRNIVGLTYDIQLSLLADDGTDQYPLLSTDLICRFEPADGRPPVIRPETHRLQIGSARAGVPGRN